MVEFESAEIAMLYNTSGFSNNDSLRNRLKKVLPTQEIRQNVHESVFASTPTNSVGIFFFCSFKAKFLHCCAPAVAFLVHVFPLKKHECENRWRLPDIMTLRS